MLNSNSICIIQVYSPSISRKTISYFLYAIKKENTLIRSDISCVSSMTDIGIKRCVLSNAEGLQLTFARKEDRSYTSINLQFSQAMKINLDKLEEIALFKENWNGYAAEPLSELVLTRAEDVIRTVYRQPDLFPTADNSIQIEYEKSNGAYLEIQITDGEAYEVFFMSDKDSKGEEFLINAKAEDVNEEVKKFYAS